MHGKSKVRIKINFINAERAVRNSMAIKTEVIGIMKDCDKNWEEK